MSDPYHDHLLHASDVCSSCMRRIRVERIDPTRSGVAREYESTLTRNDRTTTIGYGPAPRVAEQKGVFCTKCGTESAFDRYWDDDDVDREQFRELVGEAIQTLELKGVSIDRLAFAERALAARSEGYGVDTSLKTATDHAIAIAAVDNSEQAEVQT